MSLKLLLILCSLSILNTTRLPEPGTETIHSIAHVKAGHEKEYARLSADAWTLYRRLGLVLDHPHVVLRGDDDKGLSYFVEIFTWKSPDIPDHAPPEIKAIWRQLEQACERRDGRPGIDFGEVIPLKLD